MAGRISGLLLVLVAVASCHKHPLQMSQKQESHSCTGASSSAYPHERELYRRLVKEYERLATSEEHFQEKAALRRRISLLCSAISQQHLPLGVRREVVVDRLGPPAIDLGSTILYYGDRKSYFHCFVFRDGKLVKVEHVWTLDFEGGR